MKRNPLLSICLLVALTVSLILLTAGAASGGADVPAPARPNLLQNPGLEGKYNQQCSRIGGEPWVPIFPCNPSNFDTNTTALWATAQVPTGWAAWWQPPNDNQKDPYYFNSFPAYCDFGKRATPSTCVPWHNPEFRDTAGGPQDYGPSRKVAGDNSQKYFTFYSIHEAGLYQVVGGVKSGQRLRFSIYMEAWSSPFNDPSHSSSQPSMGMKVGIDPYGGSNPWSSNIVWSPIQESFDHFSLFTVEAVARNNAVSVWTHSQPVYPLEHNDVYVDEASLMVVGGGVSAQSQISVRPKRTTTVKRSPTPDAMNRRNIGDCPYDDSFRCSPVNARPTAAPVSANPTSPTVAAGSNTYVVQRGDTLRSIAKRFGLHWADIAALNPAIKPPGYILYVGQVIRLR